MGVVQLIDAQELLKAQFPVKTRSHFIPALKRAYGLVEACQKDNKWLNWIVGKDGLGILRKIAAEYEIIDTIERLALPIRYETLPNSSNNAYHVELVTELCRVTINQVDSKLALPRPAVFRTFLVPSNQLRLFDDDPAFNDEDKPIYVILAHKSSYRGLLHSAILGIPEPNLRGWATTLDLMHEPHQIYEVPTEIIKGKEKLVDFKEHVEEVLKYGKGEESE